MNQVITKLSDRQRANARSTVHLATQATKRTAKTWWPSRPVALAYAVRDYNAAFTKALVANAVVSSFYD